MRMVRLSESCIIFKELSTDPAPIANSLNQTPPPGLIEAVPAFDQLAIYFDPDIFSFNSPESPHSVSMERACPGLDLGRLGGEVVISDYSTDGESWLNTLFGDLGGGNQKSRPTIEIVNPSLDGEGQGWGDNSKITISNFALPSPDGESLPRTRSGGQGWGDQTRISPDLESAPPPPPGEDLGGGHQIEPTTSKVVPPSPDGEGKGWGDKTRFSSDFESAPPPPLGEDLGGGIKNEAPNSHTTNSDSNLENLPQSPSALSSKSENTLLKLIPAVYNGPDLEAAAKTLKLTIEELIRIHSQNIYTVEAIGFCPGFPYLSGLPQPLQNLPRKSTPRTAVEPGSIGITSDQCCIYPLVRPGGWNLIAQTPLTLVDPDSNYFPLQVGDKIQFQPITNSQFQELKNKRL